MLISERGFRVIVLNATVINISVISWQLISGRGFKTSKIYTAGFLCISKIINWKEELSPITKLRKGDNKTELSPITKLRKGDNKTISLIHIKREFVWLKFYATI